MYKHSEQPITEAEGLILLGELDKEFADDNEMLHEFYDNVAMRILKNFAPSFVKKYNKARKSFWYA